MKRLESTYFILSIYLVVFLSACQPSILIELIRPSTLPAPSFKIISPDGSQQSAKFTTIEVLDTKGKVLWRAQAAYTVLDGANLVITYGQAPEGMNTTIGPELLANSETYTLSIYGQGTGKLIFNTDEQGRVFSE